MSLNKNSLRLLLTVCLLVSSQTLFGLYFQGQNDGKQMSFQGTLYENGVAVNGNRTFTFTIPLDNGEEWTEIQEEILVVEGLYSVTLGSVNPLPDNLFYTADARQLTVAIGSTTLGSTSLFAPFGLNDGKNFEMGEFELISTEKADTVALSATITGNGADFGAAIYASAKSDSTNYGVFAEAAGKATNPRNQTGLYGMATSNSAGWSTGTWGIAQANAGSVAYGMRGQVSGTGGTFSAAARGLNFVAPDPNHFRYGGYFNTYTGDEIYDGESTGVRGNGGGSTNNYGVIGQAFSAGNRNVGVMGVATEGAENYSGWFVGGKFILDNVSELNFWGENPFIQLKVSGRGDEEWPTDQSGHGQFSLAGPNGQNVYFGARVWEEGGADRPMMQMFGAPVQDPNNPDNTYNVEGVFLSVQDFGDGLEQGVLQLGKEGESPSILNKDKLASLTNMVDGNGKYRFEVNEQNSGVLKLMSAVDSVNVLIDSNGEKAGLIILNDSLGRENLKLQSFSGGAAYMAMSAGIENLGENRVTAQYWGGQTPYVNLIGRDDDGNAIGRAQMITQGQPAVRVVDSNNRWLVNMTGNTDNGGEISIEGPSSSNFWLGQKNWEDSNLPYLAMRGAYTEDDGNGNFYNRDILSFEVSRYQDGSENALIIFSRALEGEGVNSVALDYNTVNNLVNPDAFRVLGANGNEVAQLQRRGDNFGQASFLNENSELRAEIGSFGDNSGFMQLYGPNGSKNLQMGGSDDNRDFGMLRLSGASENNLINLEIRDNNGQEYGAINLLSVAGGNINLNGTGYAYFSSNIEAASFDQISDRRLKKNVTTLTSGLATVKQLRGVKYAWKDETKSQNKVGFIAQEVEAVLPELVNTNDKGFKSVNYSEMTAVLVEAVKELSKQIEELKNENSQLKAELSKTDVLENRLSEIEALLKGASVKVNANQK